MMTAATELLGRIDTEVGKFIERKFLGLSVSPEMEKHAYNYFISNSVITAATVANRGSSVTMSGI